MVISDILDKLIIPVGAAFLGAFLAFRYQNRVELKRDKRLILQNLMIYRNAGASELDWIKALNAIDIVFNDDLEVKRLYHLFLDQTIEPAYQNGDWMETYYQMVLEMAKCSGYRNLTIDEARNFYSPKALSQHYPNTGSADLVPPALPVPDE